MLKSCLCTQAQLTSPEFVDWVRRMEPGSMREDGVTPKLHRKLWEYCYIAQALAERDMLRPGRRGLGFAVGKEPMVSLFAGLGCRVTATDLHPEQAASDGWVATNQHASIETLNDRGLCDHDEFMKLVDFRYVDMNHIPPDLRDYDFCWSSCSFEHLGSIANGIKFIENMMHCLKPGGVAVHTTEFNLTSNDHTVDNLPTVIYRRRDIEEMARRVEAAGHHVSLDLTLGDQPADVYIDAPPYHSDPHLKLLLFNHVSTSVGLIITKRAAVALSAA